MATENRREEFLAEIAGLGTASPPITRMEMLFKKIAERLTNIASGILPAVTASDNGDVLTVVNGAWDKAAPGGGGASALVAEVLIEEATEYLDKTWQEIVDAMPLAYVYYNGEGGYSYCPVVATVEEGGVYAVAFFNFMDMQTNIWTTNASNGHPAASK